MEGSTYFRKLSSDEKVSKLALLTKTSQSEIFLWRRGDEEKTSIKVLSYDKNNFSYELESITDVLRQEQNLLFTFYLDRVQYFGEGHLHLSGSTLNFVCTGDVFKTEKRESFRLLSYPHHEIYLMIEVNKQDSGLDNVINIKTGKNDDELFDSFLDLIDEKSGISSGFAKFRVIDLSVTGLAFQYSHLEKEFLQNIDITNRRFLLDFEGEEIKVAGIEFVHLELPFGKDKFKAGVRFVNVDINFDETLGGHINKAMRKG